MSQTSFELANICRSYEENLSVSFISHSPCRRKTMNCKSNVLSKQASSVKNADKSGMLAENTH